MTDAILDHIRIVDLSWGLAGPIASRLLAEAGADVIKVDAKQTRVNRSALIREALRAHLKRLRYQEMERQEREAYERTPDDVEEARRWERVADWPDD